MRSGWIEMADSEPTHDNPRNVRNLPVVVEPRDARPSGENWLLRAIRILFGWKAGSVRDDGPLPDVIMDMAEAQRRMREAVKGVAMALMIATMLHSIATGNLLPASVKVVAVDINPAVVTKLADRGTFQALGLVTDAELFVRELAQALKI